MCKKKLHEEFLRTVLVWGGISLLLFLLCFFYYSEKYPKDTIEDKAEKAAIEVEKIIIERSL